MSEAPSFWKRLLRFLGGETPTSAAMRESITEAIEESERESPALSAQERVMLANLLRFGEIRVHEVMVPRAEIVAADESMPLGELVQLFREAQHSRLPVFRDTLDDPTGLVHVKDVLARLHPTDGHFRFAAGNAASLRRPILFVPPSMRALDLLLKMQASHTHLALVIDEYGGTDGLVSIEDLIEEIVGDIADEHDEDTLGIRPDGEGFIADARTGLDDFERETGIDLTLDDAEEGGVDSLGGLVISLLGRVPQRGEIVAHPRGYEFEVLEADPRRVRTLRIRGPRPAAT
jgi:CBS domain containing-hemolysin-like protein